MINRMQCASTIACTLNVRADFTRVSPRNCKQTGDLKRGIRGRLCFASSQLQADRNSSPLVSLLINLYLKSNFKIPLTRKSWLLKFGFACSLAQILEPKLLAHEILKFDRQSLSVVNLIPPNSLVVFLALKFALLALLLGVQASLFFGRKFH